AGGESPMKVIETALSGVLIIEPKVFGDARGFFLETFHKQRYTEAGIPGEGLEFVQDNHSRSRKGVLRGLHFQLNHPQGKLVSVAAGCVFDVAVDINPDSPTCGCWEGTELSEDNHRQLWVPPGYAHGFCVLSDSADFQYKCTDVYHPGDEGGVLWNDPDIGIDWPLDAPLLSAKDSALPRLTELSRDRLPQRYQR
ncbi:MAG: dTDP-4-dehydrorhamnose 3,5-epimerase, partial [Mariprofundaceae bacterium]|nr:dTDP-4-dehydrorhamnose 3,5-epimerase [Mariprofundaceae bacterium]